MDKWEISQSMTRGPKSCFHHDPHPGVSSEMWGGEEKEDENWKSRCHSKVGLSAQIQDA